MPGSIPTDWRLQLFTVCDDVQTLFVSDEQSFPERNAAWRSMLRRMLTLFGRLPYSYLSHHLTPDSQSVTMK